MDESTQGVMPPPPAEEGQVMVQAPPAGDDQIPWNTDRLPGALAHLLDAIVETTPELGEAIFLGAVPLWFDQDLLAALRQKRDGLEDIILDRMKRLPFVEIREGRFRYRREVRDQLMQQWREDPARLAGVNERALEHLETRRATTRRDSPWYEVLVQAELHHMLAVDEPAGLQRLQALFREAEDSHRLAAAEQYLDIALNQKGFLSPEGHLWLDYLQGRLDQLYEQWEASQECFEELLKTETLSDPLAACLHRALGWSLVEQDRWSDGVAEFKEALKFSKRLADPADTVRTMAGLGHAHLSWALSVWGSGWLQQPSPRSRFQFLYDGGNLLARLPLVLYLMVQLGFGNMLPVLFRIGHNVDWIVARLLSTAAQWLHWAEKRLVQDPVAGNPPQEVDLALLIPLREDQAHLYRLLNHPRRAEAINQDLLTMKGVAQDDYRAARARLGIAHAQLLRHDAAGARSELEKVLPVFQTYGHWRRVAETLTLLARAEVLTRELDDAVEHYKEALSTWQLVGDQTSITDVVHEMEALEGQRGLSSPSQQAISLASHQVSERHYLTRYHHPVLLNFQKVSLFALVIVFFLALWLAIHNETGAAIGATAAVFKPIHEEELDSQELLRGTVLTIREQVRPETEPTVLAVALGAAVVAYLIFYSLLGVYFIVTTPLHTVRRERVRGVIMDDGGVQSLVGEGEPDRLEWGNVTSLVVSNCVLGPRPLAIISFLTLMGREGHVTVSAFTRHYESLHQRLQTRLGLERVHSLGFSVPRSKTGWLFVGSLTFLILFSILSWLKPDLLTQSWDPVWYSLADLYSLAYLGLAFPLGWWLVVQPMRAHFLVHPRSRLVWWVGAAGLILSVVYLLQVTWVHVPVPRPDVALGVISIVLTGLFAAQITGTRQTSADGTEQFVSSRVRVLSLLGALAAVAIVVFSIAWELVGFHHLVRGNYYWKEAEKAGKREVQDYASALNAYGLALRYRKEPAVYNSRGAIYARVGEYERAIEEYETALKLRPREWAYVSNMAQAYVGWAAETDNLAQRFECYGRAVALHDVAITEMEVKVSLYHMQLVTAYLLRGDALFGLGQLYEAEGPLKDRALAREMYQLAANDYKWVIDHAQTEPEGYIQHGWAQLSLSQRVEGEGDRELLLEQALADFEQAVKLTAEHEREVDRAVKYIRAFSGQGWAHYYLALIHLVPDSKDPFPCRVGEDVQPEASYFQDQTQSAVEAYTRLIGWQRDRAANWRVRAQFHWLLNRCDGYDRREQLERSLSDYDEALNLAPDNAEWYYRRGHLHYALAGLYEDQERKERSRRSALEDLETAATLKATSVQWWLKLAQVGYEYRDYTAAAKGYEQATKLDPDNGDYFWKLGWRLYLIREYQRSVEASDQAIVLLPKEPMPYFNQGLAYAAMGDLKAALASYLGGIKVAEQLEEAARQRQYQIGLADLNSANDVSEDAVAYLRDLLQKAHDGELHEFVCKVVSDQPDGLTLYAAPRALDSVAVGALIVDAQLTPLARSPDGRWIHVEVEQTGDQGWIRSNKESVLCNIDITGLPVE